MNFPKRRIVSAAQLAVFAAALLVSIVAVASTIHRVGVRRDAAELAEQYARMAEGTAATTQPSGDKGEAPGASGGAPKSATDQQAERVSKRNVFAAKPKVELKAKLLGVLGETAFFKDSPDGVKVGQDVGGGKLKSIGPDWVEIEFHGKVQKLPVFGGEDGGPTEGQPGPGGPPGGPRFPSRGSMTRAPGSPAQRSAERTSTITLTPEMIERFKRLPPEQRQKALEQAPPEIREQLSKEL